MLPSFSQQDAADTVLANTILVSQAVLSKLGSSYLFNVLNRKFAKIVMFTTFIVGAMSLLLHHVLHVLSVGAYAQMRRINARWVVARMHDFHVWWNDHVVSQHPRHSIGHVHFSAIMNAEKSLASLVFGGCPKPAIMWRRFLDFAPEALFKLCIKH